MTWSQVVEGMAVTCKVKGCWAIVEISHKANERALAAAQDAVLQHLQATDAVLGFVVCCRRADLDCSAADLAVALSTHALGHQATMPAAICARPDQLGMLRQFVWESAWRGLVRQVFTDETAALAWLSERAEAAAQLRASLLPG